MFDDSKLWANTVGFDSSRNFRRVTDISEVTEPIPRALQWPYYILFYCSWTNLRVSVSRPNDILYAREKYFNENWWSRTLYVLTNTVIAVFKFDNIRRVIDGFHKTNVKLGKFGDENFLHACLMKKKVHSQSAETR